VYQLCIDDNMCDLFAPDWSPLNHSRMVSE
jgi:hypothetical protein